MREMLEQARSLFHGRYTKYPAVYGVAPGRVEVLGNHTDYNGGYVMSAAIDRVTIVAVGKSDSVRCRVFAQQKGVEASFALDAVQRDPHDRWADYVKGVVVELQKAGVPVEPFEAVVTGNVPIGAGVSSSASLEVATAVALLELHGAELSRWDVARLCRRAENEFVGMPCGILDQFSSLFGEEDSILFLDTRTEEHEALPLPAGSFGLILFHSMAQHALVSGDYATRYRECMEATAWFRERLGEHVQLLRDVSWEEFLRWEAQIPEPLRRRARHVISENQRVLDGREALHCGDIARLGELMFASHESSRVDYENSTPELDVLVNLAKQHGAIGARLTGAGWGGATINLVQEAQMEEFALQVAEEYTRRTGIEPGVYRCHIAQGARALRE
ncbi:MAG: galactokinase [Armatimonadota bacterium]|nr:galactokinase [bacterium]MDW8320790.1 galactokinase [Armatimonadota bacterium]